MIPLDKGKLANENKGLVLPLHSIRVGAESGTEEQLVVRGESGIPV